MLRRYSSRRASLYEGFLRPRLAGAERYDRIAGYFQSSLLELASESLAHIPRIRIVCNTEVDQTVLTLIAERDETPFTLKETTQSLDADWDATAEVLNQIETYQTMLTSW
jgi:hypothetical protein